jgi:hypothetical protein
MICDYPIASLLCMGYSVVRTAKSTSQVSIYDVNPLIGGHLFKRFVPCNPGVIGA